MCIYQAWGGGLQIAATSVIFARVGAAIAHRLPVRYLQRAICYFIGVCVGASVT